MAFYMYYHLMMEVSIEFLHYNSVGTIIILACSK
jgi:hypothetical protein